MTGPHASVPRKLRTTQYLCATILEQLVEVFIFYSPESDRDFFLKEIYHPIRTKYADGDAMVKHCKEENNGKLASSNLIFISCAYCLQAAKFMDKPDLAKSYLMDATLYLGMARSSMVTEPQVDQLREAVSKEARRLSARHSVSFSVDPWHKAGDEARRLIRELAEAGTRWATPLEAAISIAEAVEMFLQTAKPLKRFQTEQGRNQSIEGWLREMPEASQLFGSFQKSSSTVES